MSGIAQERDESAVQNDFTPMVGDLVWAKLPTNRLWWPATVCDWFPEAVLKSAKKDHLCVVLFGPSPWKHGGQEYAWLLPTPSFVLPFDENMDLQSQNLVRVPRGVEFKKAVQEALMVSYGFDDRSTGPPPAESSLDPNVAVWHCNGCGTGLHDPFISEKLPDSKEAELSDPWAARGWKLCGLCIRLHKAGQYCFVCGGVWASQVDSQDWVGCDKCDAWTHASCDGIDRDGIQKLGAAGVEYHCPKCRTDPTSPDADSPPTRNVTRPRKAKRKLQAQEGELAGSSLGSKPAAKLPRTCEVGGLRRLGPCHCSPPVCLPLHFPLLLPSHTLVHATAP
ncbi:hypothetical protein CYMTET_18299 [Cymbomonas tetramitiformis]|uniref:PWWP domain-containing protein n=1 Tax=Cymbomonas tetramitiformis TaxID=36881 RepID=A0AAE0G8J1_9CHLO|nr:hypothetical protein CYMTET_18299 [Cymbomonas tetramitiformis]